MTSSLFVTLNTRIRKSTKNGAFSYNGRMADPGAVLTCFKNKNRTFTQTHLLKRSLAHLGTLLTPLTIFFSNFGKPRNRPIPDAIKIMLTINITL